ncbi:MAG: hypothetical protein ABIS21_05195 [Acidimicrobiales bacterium]
MNTTVVDADPPASAGGSGRAAGWTKETFGPDSGRRVLFALESVPLAVGGLGEAMMGHHREAADRQRRLAGRLLGMPFDAQPGGDRWARVFGHAILSLPLGVLGWIILALMVPNSLRNLAYPFFAGDYSHSWGGPTLAGAWAVHAGLVLVMLPGWIWLLRGLTHLQGALAGRVLGGSTQNWTLAVAVVAAAAGMIILRALIHQL